MPHEAPERAAHGGSSFETADSWQKPHRPNRLGEWKVMVPEMLLMKGLWSFNRRLWYPIVPVPLRPVPHHRVPRGAGSGRRDKPGGPGSNGGLRRPLPEKHLHCLGRRRRNAGVRRRAEPAAATPDPSGPAPVHDTRGHLQPGVLPGDAGGPCGRLSVERRRCAWRAGDRARFAPVRHRRAYPRPAGGRADAGRNACRLHSTDAHVALHREVLHLSRGAMGRSAEPGRRPPPEGHRRGPDLSANLGGGSHGRRRRADMG